MKKSQSILSENEMDSVMIEEIDKDTVQICVSDAETGEEQCGTFDKKGFDNTRKLALGEDR